MPKIAPNAVVDPNASLAEDVEVGPFCVVGPDVRIEAGTRLLAHVCLYGRTRIGRGNTIHPFAVLGDYPQDLKYRGEPTGLEIGDNNQIREHVTIHTGTTYGSTINGGGITRVGDGNLLMVNCHVGHDCQIGSRCIIANNVMIAGHVVIGDNVVLNGGVGINAWVSIGDFAYVDGAARIHHDVPPFVKVSDANRIRSINEVGLKRGGFTDDDISALDSATRKLFISKSKPQSVAMAEFNNGHAVNARVKQMVDFIIRRNTGRHGRYLEGMRR